MVIPRHGAREAKHADKVGVRMTERESAPAGGTENPEAATSPRGVSKAVSWGAFFTTYFPAFLLALGTGIVLPAIPAMAQSFDVSFGVASTVVTSFLIGNLAGTLPSGWMIDRFGRRMVIITGPLIAATASLAIVFAESFTQLVILRFVAGFAAQMWLMGRLAAISHGAAASERGRQVSWLYGMDSVGKLSGPLVGAFIATSWGLRGGFVVYAVLALIALIPTILYAEDTPRHARNETSATVRKLSRSLATAFDDMTRKLAERESELRTANRHLAALATSDGLSGLANRRGFDARLEAEWELAAELKRPIGLLMIDVDHFKLFNDRYGHLEGDHCLRGVGEVLLKISKDEADFGARYGGEEFVLLLPGASIEKATEIAEQLRRTVESLSFTNTQSPWGFVTVSVGIASMVPKDNDTSEKLVEAADAGLYDAKRRGRNTVVVHDAVVLSEAC